MYHGEFRDPRLVPLYDAQFGWGPDDDLFLSIVDETPSARVLDLGCGTGRLTIAIAASGHLVTGVDPAGASLDLARAKPGADRVTWVEGTSSTPPDASFDVAVMTSHVAQFFVEDDAWERAFADLKRSLVPGGRLAFDTRDPRARAWERWNPVDSRRQVTLPDGGTVDVWTEVTAVDGDVVSFVGHYAFSDGEERLSAATMRFRSEEHIRASLERTGLHVREIYGGWNREPIGEGNGEFVVIAQA